MSALVTQPTEFAPIGFAPIECAPTESAQAEPAPIKPAPIGSRRSGHAEAPATRRHPAAPARSRHSGPRARSGQAGRPLGVAGPRLGERAVSGAELARPVAPRRPGVAPAAAGVRLTDRGIAVVLFLGALLMLAALTCVGLTALRVTAEPAPVTVVATR